MVVRLTTGEVRAYPAVTAIQMDSVCRVVIAPVRNVPEFVRRRCMDVAMHAIDCLGEGATGIFGVELFLLTKNGESSSSSTGELDVLLNEVAPCPHNTGHYTQDARHSTLPLCIVDIDGFSIIIILYYNDYPNTMLKFIQ
jgi:phosphoribosylaminoimidazole carboxylase (NCAIR synthetase)